MMLTVCAKNFKEWRDQSRELLLNKVDPANIHWSLPGQAGLFNTPNSIKDQSSDQSSEAKLSVPAKFISLATQAACFEDNSEPTRKWSILYSLLWRIHFEHRSTLSIKTDPQVSALYKMVKSVSRDMHKMKAFVRFSSSSRKSLSAPRSGSEDSYYTAWFEPEHAIIEAIAPFFVKRFNGMQWSILTPYGCAHWNKKVLKLSPATIRPELSTDDLEIFWKTYYRHIFNPARLKEKAMMAEMPKKYWQYLPEADCILELTRQSAADTQNMMSSALSDPERVRQTSANVAAYQNHLRDNNQR